MGIENPVHLLFIAAVALLVLGPKRLPGLARALGEGIREFRSSLAAGQAGDADDAQPPPGGAPAADPVAGGEAAGDRLQAPDQGAASDER